VAFRRPAGDSVWAWSGSDDRNECRPPNCVVLNHRIDGQDLPVRLTRLIVVFGALAIVAAACGGGDGAAPAGTIKVTATEMKIESDYTTFKVGVPYHFEVTSEGAIPHEVMLVQPIAAGTMTMEDMDAMALGMVEEEDLPPGATASFDYTFTSDDLAGPLELACHVEGHYEAGMLLPITVEE